MVEDVEVTLDLNNLKLTNRDVIDLERYAGITFNKAFGGDEPDPPYIALMALVYVVARKANPKLTFDETLDADVKDEELQRFAEAAKQQLSDPTPPVKAKAGKVTSKK